MDLIDMNCLRISVNDAHKFGVEPGFVHFNSNDSHGTRFESNWHLCIGRLWLQVKYRPNGKRPSRRI